MESDWSMHIWYWLVKMCIGYLLALVWHILTNGTLPGRFICRFELWDTFSETVDEWIALLYTFSLSWLWSSNGDSLPHSVDLYFLLAPVAWDVALAPDAVVGQCEYGRCGYPRCIPCYSGKRRWNSKVRGCTITNYNKTVLSVYLAQTVDVLAAGVFQNNEFTLQSHFSSVTDSQYGV